MPKVLPEEFFTRFFKILTFTPEQSRDFQHRINRLAQRAFTHHQLMSLDEPERSTYADLLEQEGISSETISEFISMQIDPELEKILWQRGLLDIWQEVIEVVGQHATDEQKEAVRDLLREYSEETPV